MGVSTAAKRKLPVVRSARSDAMPLKRDTRGEKKVRGEERGGEDKRGKDKRREERGGEGGSKGKGRRIEGTRGRGGPVIAPSTMERPGTIREVIS